MFVGINLMLRRSKTESWTSYYVNSADLRQIYAKLPVSTGDSDASGSSGGPISEVEVVIGSRNLKDVCELQTNFSCWSDESDTDGARAWDRGVGAKRYGWNSAR